MHRSGHPEPVNLYVADSPWMTRSVPGPLSRALRVLRRVSTLLEEPAPAPKPVSSGIFDGTLFTDESPLDAMDKANEEEHMAASSASPPSLGGQWVGLLDRTFLSLCWALRRAPKVEGVYGESSGISDSARLDNRLYSISCSLGDISHSLQALQARHAPRPVWNPWPNEMQPTDGRRERRPYAAAATAVDPDLAAELAELRAAMEKLTALVRVNGDVSPPADATPPDDSFDPDDL